MSVEGSKCYLVQVNGQLSAAWRDIIEEPTDRVHQPKVKIVLKICTWLGDRAQPTAFPASFILNKPRVNTVEDNCLHVALSE